MRYSGSSALVTSTTSTISDLRIGARPWVVDVDDHAAGLRPVLQLKLDLIPGIQVIGWCGRQTRPTGPQTNDPLESTSKGPLSASSIAWSPANPGLPAVGNGKQGDGPLSRCLLPGAILPIACVTSPARSAAPPFSTPLDRNRQTRSGRGRQSDWIGKAGSVKPGLLCRLRDGEAGKNRGPALIGLDAELVGELAREPEPESKVCVRR
jgi:hypothetical protein